MSAEIIVFPRIHTSLALLVAYWRGRGYILSNNRRGRLVARPVK